MNRSQRPLIKIYKDLMVTKRDLIDLRESINQTIKSIRHSDEAIKKLHSKRKCSKCGGDTNPAQPHSCLISRKALTCNICQIEFSGVHTLNQHRQQRHKICSHCSVYHTESTEDHENYHCPNIATLCEHCDIRVQKKDLDRHFKICSFRECPKCKKEIYIKAYTFHLQECNRLSNKNLITPCKRLIRPKQPRPLVIPCCLVLQGEN